MNTRCNRLLNDYNEGRTTATGFIIDFLNAAQRGDLEEALDLFPSDLAHVPHLRGRTRAQVLIFQGRLPQWGQKA
jgi:hypothetical protein